MGNTTANPKGTMKLMPMGGIQDENGDYVMESFIIRACNSHEALVASVEALRRRLSLDFTEASPESDNKLLVDALNALKLAKP